MTLAGQSALGSRFGAARLVASLSRPGFDVIERGDLGCVLCTAAVDSFEVIEELSSLAEIQIPHAPGPVAQTDERWAMWLSPRSWLIVCAPPDESKLVASINAATTDRVLLASFYTDYLCWLSLEGEVAEDVLRQGSYISLAAEGLPAGHAKRTLVAGIPVIIFRRAATRWVLGIERSRARYIVEWLQTLDT